jgi:hypothetical protein
MISIKKKVVLIILLVANSWIQCISQDNDELRIKQIETEYEKIDRDVKKFRMAQEDVNDRSEEGGILIKYYDGQILRKAVLTLFGETGQSTTEYYFLNGNLIFAKEQIDMYTGPLDASKGEIESTETNKFYFNREKLIQWIDNDDEKVNSDQYPEKENEILEDIKYIINKIK